nr:hypothetical protein [uncultured Methanoregula sp.]
MQVFLSWSGERSKETAESLKKYIHLIVQAVSPVISTDIEKGTRWFSTLSKTLDETNFGICCLTQDNLTSPWLLFEAGAMSKSRDTSRLWTFLLDIEYKEIEYPLAQFQHTEFIEADFFKMITSINDLIPAPEAKLSEGELKTSFDKFWPDLESELNKIKKKKVSSPKPSRDTRDMVSEILEISRKQDNLIEQLTRRVEDCCKNISGMRSYRRAPDNVLDVTNYNNRSSESFSMPWENFRLNIDPDYMKKITDSMKMNIDPDYMKKITESMKVNIDPDYLKKITESMKVNIDPDYMKKITDSMKVNIDPDYLKKITESMKVNIDPDYMKKITESMKVNIDPDYMKKITEEYQLGCGFTNLVKDINYSQQINPISEKKLPLSTTLDRDSKTNISVKNGEKTNKPLVAKKGNK